MTRTHLTQSSCNKEKITAVTTATSIITDIVVLVKLGGGGKKIRWRKEEGKTKIMKDFKCPCMWVNINIIYNI